MQTLRTLTAALVDRLNLAGLAGLTFKGFRDLYEALGYERSLSPTHYRERYERGDIAARLVEILPTATWRGSGNVYEKESTKVTTEFEQAFKSLNQRLNVWSTFRRADVLAGLGEYSAVVIGARGAMTTPLPKMRGPDDVLFLQPYGQADVLIDSFVGNDQDPRFGQVEFYQINRQRTTADAVAKRSKFTLSGRVHWSRVLHVAEGCLDDNVNGQPRLRRSWNRLDDLDKVLGGGAEAFWMRAHQGYQFNLPDGFKFKNDDEKKKFNDEVDEFVNGMRRTMRTVGVDVETFGSDVANFDRNALTLISVISGCNGIPQRMLLGSERGELASIEDRNNWSDRVQERRANFAEPTVVRPFINRLMLAGALPLVPEFKVFWPEVLDMPPTERAELADKEAGLNQKTDFIVVTPDELRETLGREPLEKVDKDAAAANKTKLEMKANPPTPPPVGAPPPDPNAPPVAEVPPARAAIARVR